MTSHEPLAQPLEQHRGRAGEVSAHYELVDQYHRDRDGELLEVAQCLVGRLVRRERSVEADDELSPGALGREDRRRYCCETRNRERLVPLQGQAVDAVPLQILEEQVRGPLEARGVERRCRAAQHEPEKAGPHMAIEEVVLELVLVAAEAAIAGSVAALGALLQDP